MHETSQFEQIGSIAQMVQNEGGGYQGDMRHYVAVICLRGKNIYHPYHNLRHLLHVAWLCYGACRYYCKELSPRECRNLIIAALFHDFNHSGGTAATDDENIKMAVEALKRYILEEDRPYIHEIVEIIASTRFPYTVPSRQLPLVCQIVRDADAGQAFSTAWIQETIGLGKEKGRDVIESLVMQHDFLSKVSFETQWAKELFGENIAKKMDETSFLLTVLVGQTVSW
ncbi:MAG: hypothetical protein RIQ54_82 [Candidatus Parcubacteria bacterium]